MWNATASCLKLYSIIISCAVKESCLLCQGELQFPRGINPSFSILSKASLSSPHCCSMSYSSCILICPAIPMCFEDFYRHCVLQNSSWIFSKLELISSPLSWTRGMRNWPTHPSTAATHETKSTKPLPHPMLAWSILIVRNINIDLVQGYHIRSLSCPGL